MTCCRGERRINPADFVPPVNELLHAAGRLEPGNFESFYNVFIGLAERVYAQAKAIDSSKHPISARDAVRSGSGCLEVNILLSEAIAQYFRAANYFRASDFYLHGNPDDPRINDSWDRATAAFNAAIALLPIPGERLTLHTEGFDIPCTWFRASTDNEPRPTLIIHTGFDGSSDEMLHIFGFAALQRGYHVIIPEGPGQAGPRRHQNLGFIPDWYVKPAAATATPSLRQIYL